MRVLLITLVSLSMASQASAQIIADFFNAPVQAYNTNVTAASGYSPSQGTDSALIVAITGDSNVGSTTVTWGGTSLNVLANDTRTLIFGLANPGTDSGDIVVSTGANNSNFLVTYGTLQNIQTTPFPLDDSVGSTYDNGSDVITLDNPLTGLNEGDYVLSVFNVNSANNATSITVSDPLSVLHSFNGAAAGDFIGVIGGGILGSDDIVGGEYTPFATFQDNGDNSADYGVGVAFRQIPEPSAITLVLAAVAVFALGRRRRRLR